MRTRWMVGLAVVLGTMGVARAASPLERVMFRITYADGRVERRAAAAVRQADGAYRAQFRTIDMARDMKWIDVVSDAAVVPK